MDIIIDTNCSRTMDPDMAIGRSLGPDITMDPVAAQGTQINMALVAARPPDTNLVSNLRWLSRGHLLRSW